MGFEKRPTFLEKQNRLSTELEKIKQATKAYEQQENETIPFSATHKYIGYLE